MVDDHYTWWECGRSYLCRILGHAPHGYVDEVLFGKEVLDRMPLIVQEWVSNSKKSRKESTNRPISQNRSQKLLIVHRDGRLLVLMLPLREKFFRFQTPPSSIPRAHDRLPENVIVRFTCGEHAGNVRVQTRVNFEIALFVHPNCPLNKLVFGMWPT